MQKTLQEIIRDVKKGDKTAFRMLVEEFQARAFGLAFRMLGNEEDARDVVQESFIKMWQKIHTYDMKEKFSSWMYKIVSNGAIDRIRALKRSPLVRLEDLNILMNSALEEGSDIKLENAEAGMLIRACTLELPEKQKLVYSLRDLQGLSSEEVEEITGLPEDAIKSNLYHARKAMREKLMAIFTYERRDP